MRWWRLTPDEAVAVARAHAEKQGLPWSGCAKAMRRLHGGWDVMTNPRRRGGNTWVYLDRTGGVRKSFFVPR